MNSSLNLRHPILFFILSIALAVSSISGTLAQAKKQLVVDEKDLIPEGIAFDPATRTMYLSSIQKSKIVSINEKGIAKDFVPSGQYGLLQVLGMKVDGAGNLWACNNTPEHDTINKVANVHVFDRSGRLIKQYALADGKRHLFNDLYLMKNGDVYVTDSDGAALYVIKKGSDKPEPFVQGVPYPNGITATSDEEELIVSTAGALGIASVNIATKEMKSLAHERYLLIGADGLYRYKNKLIAVQNVTFPEGILEMELSSDEQQIKTVKHLAVGLPEFDTPTTGVVAGDDFYFIANSQLLQVVGNHGQIKNPGKLNPTIIMKIQLK